MATTRRWGHPYPELSDAPDVPRWMESLAVSLDGVAMDDQGALSSRPSAGRAGRYYYATDAGRLYRDDGTAWVEVALAATQAMPVGAVFASAAMTTPARCLLCDGRAYLRSSYPDLYNAIGTTYGLDGATMFKVPNLVGRTVIGEGDGVALGWSLGEKEVTLTTEQMPSHRHGPSEDIGNARFLVARRDDVVSYGPTSSSSPFYSETWLETETAPAGGGRPHNNMQPSLALRWFIRAFP